MSTKFGKNCGKCGMQMMKSVCDNCGKEIKGKQGFEAGAYYIGLHVYYVESKEYKFDFCSKNCYNEAVRNNKILIKWEKKKGEKI